LEVNENSSGRIGSSSLHEEIAKSERHASLNTIEFFIGNDFQNLARK
jgi:hypothetical protein